MFKLKCLPTVDSGVNVENKLNCFHSEIKNIMETLYFFSYTDDS